MITHAARKRTPSPVRLVLKLEILCCFMLQRCFFVFGEYQLDLVNSYYNNARAHVRSLLPHVDPLVTGRVPTM